MNVSLMRAQSSQPAPMVFAAARRCTSPFVHAPESLEDVLRFLGQQDVQDAVPPGVHLPMRRLHADQALMIEGRHPEALYIVRFGTFKSLHTCEDGYEQVLGFSGAGEILGFEGLALGWQPMTAIALEDAAVHVVPTGLVEELRQTARPFDRALQAALGRQLARRAELADLMAAVAAEVRLARFLVHLAAHAAERGLSTRRLRLPMGRRDIASYLGVAHETVSRAFGALARAGHLQARNRDIEILDPAALEACSRTTRGPAAAADPVRAVA